MCKVFAYHLFVISPSTNSVQSGTDGVYHDNASSYIVGIAPKGEHQTSIFHMGTLNPSQGDMYMPDERWSVGLDTGRWEGDATDGSSMHITVDFIDFMAETVHSGTVIRLSGSVSVWP